MPRLDPWYERLSPVDATFLYVEAPGAPMHVGGILLFEGRAPAFAELTAHVASRIERLPRFRQRLAFVPLELGRPVWIDDGGFRLERQLRHCVLPPPGGRERLLGHAAAALGEPLPLDAPLWSMELVDGIGPDRFALLTRTHHCLLDGIAYNEFLASLTDGDSAAAPPAPPRPWRPRPAPGPAQLALAAWRDALSEQRRRAGDALRSRDHLRSRLLDSAREARALLSLARRGPAPASSLNQPVGPRRACELLSLDLATVKRVGVELDATVNDVLLGVVAGALGRLLRARGELPVGDLRAFVPVNVRHGASAAPGNHIGAIHCPLPVSERDPAERVRTVGRAMRALKEAREADATASLLRLAELAFPPLAAEAARREEQYRRFNLVVSNVPGSPTPRYLLGRRLLQFHPYIPLGAHQTLSIGMHSLAGSVGVGLLADARGPELPLLAAAMRESLAELVGALRLEPLPAAPPPPLTGDSPRERGPRPIVS
jgi:WS/DGAT/MGAT family acyltransferase